MFSSMAKVGGGKFFDTIGAVDLTTALNTILNEVQAVNSVFSSASLPVSVNAQGTYLNQIYLGMFRPDASGSPRWMGNLKQYKLVKDSTGNLVLGDAKGNSAISAAGTGFISPGAAALDIQGHFGGARQHHELGVFRILLEQSNRNAILQRLTRPTAKWWKRAAPRSRCEGEPDGHLHGRRQYLGHEPAPDVHVLSNGKQLQRGPHPQQQ